MPLTSINIYTIRQVKTGSYPFDPDAFTLTSPRACFDLLDNAFNLTQAVVEHFGIITLNTRHRPVGLHLLSTGKLDCTIVGPREVYQAALLNNAAAIIAFHNHPSGDPFPSFDDLLVTRRLSESGNLINLPLLDHIILGTEGKYVSLREMGMVKRQ